MTANIVRVACLGYVFDSVAQDIVRSLAPPEFDLMFAEKPDETTPALVAIPLGMRVFIWLTVRVSGAKTPRAG